MKVDVNKPMEVVFPDRKAQKVLVYALDTQGNYGVVLSHDSVGHVQCRSFDFRTGEGKVHGTAFLRNAPEKHYVPFDSGTFPKGNVWVRWKESPSVRGLVTGVYARCIAFGSVGKAVYENLLTDCEISLDGGETWVPAGILKGE